MGPQTSRISSPPAPPSPSRTRLPLALLPFSLQAKLLQHICEYAEAYIPLLLPHRDDHRVDSLLGMLCSCCAEHDVLLDTGAAASHLRMLTPLAGQLGSAVEAGGGGAGSGASGGAAQAACLQHQLAELLTSAFNSIVNATAAIEFELRQGLSRQLEEGKKGKKQLKPEQLQMVVEKRVKEHLPADDIAEAVGAAHLLAARQLRWLLQHSHAHCSPLVVAMLQLDLMTGRLPPGMKKPLGVLGILVQHG